MRRIDDNTVAIRLDEMNSAPLLSATDLIAVARGRQTFKVELEDVKALMQLGSNANFVGNITTATPTPINASWGFAEQGTYPNWGGLVVDEGDLNILTFANGVYSKTEFLDYSKPVGQVVNGDLRSVSGDTVFHALEDIILESEGFGGFIDLSTPPSELKNAFFIATETGTYANYGNIVVDMTEGLTFIAKATDVYSKLLIPIQIGNQVNTIADLRNKVGAENDIVTLLGYYEKGDKAPLNYIFKTGDHTDDEGSVIESGAGAWLAVFNNDVNISDFGCKNSLEEDSSVYFQKAIDYALSVKKNIIIDVDIYIENTINIDRVVDGVNVKDYFFVKNGRIKVAENVTLFSSSITMGLGPVSQLVCFENVNFEGEDTSFIMEDNKLLRIIFSNCSFVKLKFSNSQNYLQSIYFNKCNVRGNSGTFLIANGGCYDMRFNNCIVEHLENFIEANGEATHKVQLWINDCVIEGLSGIAVSYSQASVISLTGNYFEHNEGGTLVRNENAGSDTTIVFDNNFCFGTGNDNTGGNGYFHIVLGDTLSGSVSHNANGANNLVYLKTDLCDVQFNNNYGDVSINKVGKRSKMYFGNGINGETLSFGNWIAKGSIIWNTNITTVNDWIGAICTTDNLNYLDSQWTKFGDSLVKKTHLTGAENLDTFLTTGVFFPSNEFAVTGTNFPTSNKGILEVFQDYDPNQNNVLQRYTSISTSSPLVVYNRHFYGIGGGWSVWY